MLFVILSLAFPTKKHLLLVSVDAKDLVLLADTMSMMGRLSSLLLQPISLLAFNASVWLALAMPALGATYTHGINPEAWQVESTVFECRLTHNVPFFGSAVFSTRAGEQSRFYLSGYSARFAAGEAEVVVKEPVWMQSERSFSLGTVPVKQGTRPLWLKTRFAEKMLHELNQGNEIEFSRKAWFEPPEKKQALSLAIGNIGFRDAYNSYLRCLVGLLPQNFDQLRRTALYFRAGLPEEMEDGLSRENMRILDNILKLVENDKRIRKFYIDGHASAEGDLADNFSLSQRRAELVANYLKDRGIPEDWIILRWHGERYPVVSNATAGGRARNRRTTVRLERIEKVETIPLSAKVDQP